MWPSCGSSLRLSKHALSLRPTKSAKEHDGLLAMLPMTDFSQTKVTRLTILSLFSDAILWTLLRLVWIRDECCDSSA